MDFNQFKAEYNKISNDPNLDGFFKERHLTSLCSKYVEELIANGNIEELRKKYFVAHKLASKMSDDEWLEYSIADELHRQDSIAHPELHETAKSTMRKFICKCGFEYGTKRA